jgi:hypothetical protein
MWKVRTEIHLPPPLRQVKYEFHGIYFLQSDDCLMTLYGGLLYRISPKSVKKYGKNGWEIFHALSYRLSLSRFL